MQTTIFIILSFFAGALISYLYAKSVFGSKDNASRLAELETHNITLNMENKNLLIKLAKSEEKIETMTESYKDLKDVMSSMGETYKAEFKNVANELLELKSKSLDETSTKNIKTILDPLNR